MHSKGQSFIKGAAILGIAALISKLLGAVYRIPYQNITGDVGLAVYNKVYPIYSMLLIIATAGFPIAISKMVSERLALGDKRGAKRIFKISAYILSMTGILFFIILYFGSDLLAVLMGNQQLSIAIKSVSFALLIVPLMAAIRGYYQGHQYMVPTAYSQIVEQIVRVITILVLSYWFIKNDYGVYYAGAGAVFGAFSGAIFAFAVLLLFWKKTNRMTDEIFLSHGQVEIQQFSQQPVVGIIKKILYYSIPIALGSLILPLFGVVDSFSVSNLLQALGFEKTQSEYWFGIYTRGQPLVQFTAFFATSLSLALVPSISEASARKNHQLIQERTDLALRLTLLIGLPASVGLAVIAEPANILLYENNVGTKTLAILAFTSMFSTLGITSSGILQGIGQVILPARNLFIGVIIKLVLNLILIRTFGIDGAALATVSAYAVATFLNLIAVNQYTGIKIGFLNFFVKPTIATLMMGAIVWIAKEFLELAISPFIPKERLLMAVVSIVSVSLGIIVFAFSLFIFGAITKKDLINTPKVGKKLITFTERLRILKD
ncbi:polysaccharide biosynthesis protein [Tepidibacillus sp. HK-1]|uniref:putative polysaccharide biosynthesis protein n=1 Tax=Tepidibacillus sp. HK-1 TaxID=1883407 RepID=UPI000853CDF3|nr:polysaccharide biosynthesis protein [Tepidibacillus sp. HK-1]GBF11396.1 putative cell division protein YtgP [Tepidibacillus sp. HK-1]